MTARGASMVAISPQVPDASLTTAEKNELTFGVLSDAGNTVARSYGLVFALSEKLRPIYVELGADVPKFNGTDTFELPVPGTFVVDRSGVIRARHVNADYKQRMEPEHIIEVLRALHA
jgi:peroxiredoxin